MKKILIATGLAAGLAMQPAIAADDADKSAEMNKAEETHAPTNRVGKMVPTMSSPENTDDAAATNSEKEGNSPETLHAPTNRVGDQVPTMTAPENE
mmetsp:Transcript_10014/g.25935  ORF Transcript_10014/g.25935 Transcript_10014/m.25935 type:complete len:96 (-) Transcript_10014:45-332(-)